MAHKTLILGAGELGTAIITALLSHQSYNSSTNPITLLVRDVAKARSQPQFRDTGIDFLTGDLNNSSLDDLSALFSGFNTVIHASGMTSPPGTQLKITHAVLSASVQDYIPWQHGVDYDVIGRESGHGLFSEQLEVRDLLRSQSQTSWVIISCGIFMSFLFEDFWGVIVRNAEHLITGVRALGDWDHLLTATTAEDIGKVTAELVLVDIKIRNHPVYIAGDTLTFAAFADIVEDSVGRQLETREVWTTEYLKKESAVDPADKLKKYRVVFSEDRGLAWDVKTTYSWGKGMQMEGYREYLSKMKA